MIRRTWTEVIFATFLAAAALVAFMAIPKPKSQTASASYPIFRPLLPLVY
jgi:hypothetical protein